MHSSDTREDHSETSVNDLTGQQIESGLEGGRPYRRQRRLAAKTPACVSSDWVGP